MAIPVNRVSPDDSLDEASRLVVGLCEGCRLNLRFFMRSRSVLRQRNLQCSCGKSEDQIHTSLVNEAPTSQLPPHDMHNQVDEACPLKVVKSSLVDS